MRQQDIEIYIKGSASDDIKHWLRCIFETIELNQQTGGCYSGNALLNRESTPCELLVLENAVKGFTSVWFKQNHTPWDSDIDCARSAYQHLHREVRATTGSWREGAEEDLFCRIDARGETTIDWPNP